MCVLRVLLAVVVALVVAVVVVACRWCLVSWSLSVCGRRAHLEVVRRFWFWVLGRGDGVYVCVPSVDCVGLCRSLSSGRAFEETCRDDEVRVVGTAQCLSDSVCLCDTLRKSEKKQLRSVWG